MTETKKRPAPGAFAIFGVAAFGLAVGLLIWAIWPRSPAPVEQPVETVRQQDTDAAPGVAPGQNVAAEILPSFDVVRISREGTGVIAGRAAPNALVEVLENDRPVGEVRADANGEWVLLLETPLNPGAAELTLRAASPDGTLRQGGDAVIINVPEEQGDGFVASERDGVVAVLTDRDGGASRVLQRPGVPGGAIRDLGVDTLDYGPAADTIIGGRGLPRARVRVYLDTAFIGETMVDNEGRWSLAHAGSIAAGDHIIRLDQVVADGRVEVRVEQPFTAGQTLDPGRAQTGVRVREGNSLWEISREIFGSGRQFTLIFRENSDQIADPDLIYPNQVFRLPAAQQGG